MRCRSAHALGDLVAASGAHALGAELLDVERGQRGAVGHRAHERLVVDVLAAWAAIVADEAARERVAGAGRVDDVLQRIGGQREEALVGEQRRAVLALLGDDRRRAPAEDSRAAATRFGSPVSIRAPRR